MHLFEFAPEQKNMAAKRHWNIVPERVPGDSGTAADIAQTKLA